MTLLRSLTVVVAVVLGTAATARAYGFVPVLDGLDIPTYVTSAPGEPGTLYVVERPGRIELVRGDKVVGTFLDIRSQVWAEGEGGLLSVAFHPQYAQNHRFYVDYTDLDHNTRVVEYTSVNGVADPASARQLLFVQQPYPNHKGGQLQFDRQGRLYVGMGDGGSNPDVTPDNDPDNRAQDLAQSLGKLLRIDPLRSTTWQIVAYGLRNPWRFSFDRANGNLWLGDVGAGSYEEIDFRTKSQLAQLTNFGWSHFEGPRVYNGKVALRGNGKVVFPVWTYTHNFGSCSMIGGYVYRGSRLPGARGRYFFGDFCSGVVWTFKTGKKGRASPAQALPAKVPSLVSFGEDGNGELYAVSYDGSLYALR